MSKLVAAIIVAALAVAGCSAADVSTPPPTEGRYIIETANGAPAPAIVARWNTGGGTAVDTGTVYLIGDTLVVGGDGHYQESAWYEGRSGGLLLGRQRWYDHGDWTRSGDSLHFESEYIEYVAFDAKLSGANGLATTRDLRQEGSVDFVFRRR